VLASSRWDIVVLQEQSEIPAVEATRQSYMYPGARDLVSMIRDAGARPMFFDTWGHRNGWPINRLPSYDAMQSAIDEAYLFIAHEQHAAVAPVGVAWSAVANPRRAVGRRCQAGAASCRRHCPDRSSAMGTTCRRVKTTRR
jgi:hypothetical protein